MEIKWLKDFEALAEYRSFSKAAETRHVTQPAFSRRIRSLESWLDVSLVDRNQHPIALTDAGLNFIVEAKRLVTEVYRIRDQLHQYQAHEKSLLFLAQHSLAVSFFPLWIEHVALLIGDNLVRLQAGNSPDMLEAFTVGKGDFLLCFSSPFSVSQIERYDIERIRVGADQLVPVSAVDSEGLPLHAPRPDCSLKLLAYPDNSFFGEIIKRECLPRIQTVVNCQPMFENALADGLKALALQGRGVAWLPAGLIRHELDQRQLVILSDPLVSVNLDICLYRFRRTYKLAANGFWRHILDESANESALV